MFSGKRERRRRSSIIYTEPPESIEHISDQSALPNLNADWVNAKGAWTVHIVLIICLKILYDILPGTSQETSWTLTNITYMFGSYLMFHYVQGIPFDFNAGAYDNLNMWEQIDHGDQYTPTKKFLLSVPIMLFLLSTHYTHYDLTYFLINFLATLGVVIPKLPYSHRRRIDNQALTLLTHLSTPSAAPAASSEAASPQQAFVPPLQHISLAATLTVHPSLTSHNTPAERLQASNSALRLLHTINNIVGPVNADFASAFKFHPFSRDRRGVGAGHDRRKPADRDDVAENEQSMDHINLSMANAGSLWANADDFWHAVGWALNCSVAYPRRWARWRLWLEFMITVLQDDWRERERWVRRRRSEDADLPRESIEAIMAESMVVKYLPGPSGGYGGQRRIVRSVFADASAKAQREFRPVFKNELKDWKEEDTGVKRKRETKVNVDEDDHGDYLDNDDENRLEATPGINKGARSSTRLTKPDNGKTVEPATATADHSDDGIGALGGLEAIACRRSLLDLVSSLFTLSRLISGAQVILHILSLQVSLVSRSLPNHFTTIDALYDSYLEYLRPLPLPTFSLFLYPPTTNSHLETSEHSSLLIQSILCSMMSISAPSLRQTSSSLTDINDDDDNVSLTQETLERTFLPYPACTSSTTDNAKVSLLIEALLRLLAKRGKLNPTTALREAIEEGIVARERKTVGKSADGKKRPGGGTREEEEQMAGTWLRGSSERLRGLSDLVMMAGGSS
ncbi:MAG: hypothetical protein M1816_006914 [Peltula sp. TS41687]|nr:MAG: hypothetical protein M1816_006914 [Peltula sp. TS41687]